MFIDTRYTTTLYATQCFFADLFCWNVMFKKQEADFVAIIVPMLDISEHRPEVLTHLWSMRIAIQGKLGQINAIDPIKFINQLYEMTYIGTWTPPLSHQLQTKKKANKTHHAFRSFSAKRAGLVLCSDRFRIGRLMLIWFITYRSGDNEMRDHQPPSKTSNHTGTSRDVREDS